MIRKLPSGKYCLYSRKVDPKRGRRVVRTASQPCLQPWWRSAYRILCQARTMVAEASERSHRRPYVGQRLSTSAEFLDPKAIVLTTASSMGAGRPWLGT